MLYIGIDIGITGAVAVLTPKGELCEVFDLPTCEGRGKRTRTIDTVKLFDRLSPFQRDCGLHVAYEDIHAMPNGSIASFSLGHSLACVENVLSVLGCNSINCVDPADWKNHFGLLRKGKFSSLELSRRMYPDAPLSRKKDHNRAEALLLATYGLRINGGEP